MIFQGPQGYITPNWYPSKAQHGKAVPTWNFAVVHAYGRLELMKDKDWLLRHVTELTAQQERKEAKPWAPSDAPNTYIEVMLRGIVGFRFVITRLEGKWKMSQNREMQSVSWKASANEVMATILRLRKSFRIRLSQLSDVRFLG